MKKIIILTLLFIFFCLELWACSGIYIANENVKLFGLNEDFYDYNTTYRTLPGNATTYGIIGFGHSNSIQAIINEKGLCYDGYGAPEKKISNDNHLPENNGSFIFEAMTTCATVAEVENLFKQSFHPWLSNGQAFFTDRFGNSAIFEGDSIIHKTGDFQICTNFYQSDPESGVSYGFYPCQRFDLLKNELENTATYSIDFVRGLLDSVHVENQESPHGPISSVYSLIIDQNANKIYVYNLYDFDNVTVLVIAEELKKTSQNKTLASLFTTSIEEEKINPEKFGLYNNYPNPFNPVTNIRFSLPATTMVKLNIYNITGQLVKTLVHSRKPAGEHFISWDGTNELGNKIPSGLYFYSLLSNDFNETKQMLLLK